MPVVDVRQFSKKKKGKPKKPRRLAVFMVILGLAAGLYLLLGQKVRTPQPQTDNKQSPIVSGPDNTSSQKLKRLSGAEFKELYSSFAYPNTEAITDKPVITGNPVADRRIQRIAERRGYRLSAVPVSNIVKINEKYLTEDDLIQPNALIGWRGLKAAAKEAGIPLQITSAYRSIEFQRALFLRRMADAGITVPGIVDGFSDGALEMVMAEAAPPGYSRHHTGYTIDLACDTIGLHAFKRTSCYAWLSKNNFENAKKFGYVPSYPEEAAQQGPEPESWEYIWVSTSQLYE